jgi:hypothetical protein
MNEIESAWLAGFIEGEGTFQIRNWTSKGMKGYPCEKTRYFTYSAAVSATNVARSLLVRCKEIAGGSIFGPFGRKLSPWQKPAYRWHIQGTALDLTLPRILPFLIAKQEQAEILLLFRTEVTCGAVKGQWGRKACPDLYARRGHMKNAIHALNHRGTTPIPEEQIHSLSLIRGWLNKGPDTSRNRASPSLT